MSWMNYVDKVCKNIITEDYETTYMKGSPTKQLNYKIHTYQGLKNAIKSKGSNVYRRLIDEGLADKVEWEILPAIQQYILSYIKTHDFPDINIEYPPYKACYLDKNYDFYIAIINKPELNFVLNADKKCRRIILQQNRPELLL